MATTSEPDKLKTTPTVETVQRFDDLCASRLKDYEKQRLDAMGQTLRQSQERAAVQLAALLSDGVVLPAGAAGLVAAGLSAVDSVVGELVSQETWRKQHQAWIDGVQADNRAQLQHILLLATTEAEKKSLWTRQTSQQKLELSRRAASHQSNEAQQNLTRTLGESEANARARLQAELEAVEAVTAATKVVNNIREDEASKFAQQRLATEDTIKRLRLKLSVIDTRVVAQQKYLAKLRKEVEKQEAERDQQEHRLQVLNGLSKMDWDGDADRERRRVANHSRALRFHRDISNLQVEAAEIQGRCVRPFRRRIHATDCLVLVRRDIRGLRLAPLFTDCQDCQAVGHPVSHDDIERVMLITDEDNGGFVDLEEFASYFHGANGPKKSDTVERVDLSDWEGSETASGDSSCSIFCGSKSDSIIGTSPNCKM